jgi:hypothetical protein
MDRFRGPRHWHQCIRRSQGCILQKENVELSDTDSAQVKIKSGAVRAPHGLDTWRQEISITRKTKTYLFDDTSQVHEEVLAQVMGAEPPAWMTQWA